MSNLKGVEKKMAERIKKKRWKSVGKMKNGKRKVSQKSDGD